MTKSALAALTLAFLLTIAGTFAAAGWLFTQDSYPDGVVVTTVQSAVLGESRDLLVHLPGTTFRRASRSPEGQEKEVPRAGLDSLLIKPVG